MEKLTLQEAIEIAHICIHIQDDLPDGMADEIKDTWSAYRQTRNADEFISEIEEILEDWGFSSDFFYE